MIGGQVAGWVAIAPEARAPVPVVATPCTEHSRAQALPGSGAVQGVVSAAVRLPNVRRATTARATRDDTADRAELHSPASSGVAWAIGTTRCAALAVASRRACRSARRVCGRQIDRRPPPSPRGARGRTWPQRDEEPRVWQVRVTARSVCQVDPAVYSPVVLRFRGQTSNARGCSSRLDGPRRSRRCWD